MITPVFRISQDKTSVYFNIEAPYTDIKNTEVYVEDNDFRFYSAPYYLRLTLPGNLMETDESYAKYDADSNQFIIKLEKVNEDEELEGLDMLTTLLHPSTSSLKQFSTGPSIEVLSGKDSTEEISIEKKDWLEGCSGSEDKKEEKVVGCHKYGFNDLHSGLFDKHEVELNEICQIQSPDSVSAATRRILRSKHERENFSDDHYLFDLYEQYEHVCEIVNFKFNLSLLEEMSGKNGRMLKDLPNKQYLFDDEASLKAIYLGLVDILFGYCYDWRITQGLHCVESCWNISRLSSTLSWFDKFQNLRDVLISCLRRSLVYPLYRNFDLSLQVMKDVVSVMKSGRSTILACLLDILTVFNERSPYFILNQLYIKDYCVWVQLSSSKYLDDIAKLLDNLIRGVTKCDVDLELIELEAAADMVREEEEVFDDIALHMAKFEVNQ